MPAHRNERSITSRFKHNLTGFFDSVAEARRMQAEARRKYPHITW